MTVGIIANALADVASYFERLPDVALQAAVLAVNDAARDTVPSLKRRMRRQINFPNGYLDGQRLGIRRKATRGSIEAVISGRDRPTSLARFAQGATPENSRGRQIFVSVKPGKTVRLDKAFMVRLRNNNLGLAVRLKPGERLRNSEKAIKLANNVYLLYGPSVDQMMPDVSEQDSPAIAERATRNFYRQVARLSRG